jgi:hypothetical protein
MYVHSIHGYIHSKERYKAVSIVVYIMHADCGVCIIEESDCGVCITEESDCGVCIIEESDYGVCIIEESDCEVCIIEYACKLYKNIQYILTYMSSERYLFVALRCMQTLSIYWYMHAE